MIIGAICSITSQLSPSVSCASNNNSNIETYTFENETCKRNEIYFGKIIYWNEKKIIVQTDKGQKIEFEIKQKIH